MKYGNYWDDSQIIVAKVPDYNAIPDAIFYNRTGMPGFLAVITNPVYNTITEVIFVEIIPGTEHKQKYIGLRGHYEEGTCVHVNIYHGPTHDFDTMVQIATDTWPLSWFKLTSVPTTSEDPSVAYDRAMSIVGI